jgi:hypothetical protein
LSYDERFCFDDVHQRGEGDEAHDEVGKVPVFMRSDRGTVCVQGGRERPIERERERERETGGREKRKRRVRRG